MRLPNLLAPLFLLALTTAQNTTVVDLCPKGDYACLDVINSSQCLEQLVIESQAPVTKESMAKCVVFDESAVDLPGDVKVSLLITMNGEGEEDRFSMFEEKSRRYANK